MDAAFAVDHGHARRGLGVGQIDARPCGEPFVEAGRVWFQPPGGDGAQVDRARGADETASAARLALIGRPTEGGGDFPCRAAADKIDGAAAHHFSAYPGAQPAENALSLGDGLEGSCCHAEPGGQFGQFDRVGRLGQQQLQNRLAGFFDLRGFRMDDDVVFDRLAARGDQLPAARRFDFDQAHAARPVRRQPAIVAQGWNRHAHLPGGVEDRRAGRDAGRATVHVDQQQIRSGCVHRHVLFPMRHTPAGHCLSRMCVSNSSRKCVRVVNRAFGPMPPMPQKAADRAVLAKRSKRDKSAEAAWPSEMRRAVATFACLPRGTARTCRKTLPGRIRLGTAPCRPCRRGRPTR